MIGNFKNAGREWPPRDPPELVDAHDFPSDAIGKSILYGVYDVAENSGMFLAVPTTTPVFTVADMVDAQSAPSAMH